MNKKNISVKNEKIPALLDKEICNVDEDAFGHRHYANALKGLIESYSPPYSIGLLGSWGVGKSSIKEMYLKELNNSSDKNRKQSIHTVTFNAWRFGGLDIKKALLRHIFISLGGQEGDITNKLYSQVTENLLEKRKDSEMRKELFQNFIWYPAQFLAVSLIVIFVIFLLKLVINDLITTTILSGAFLVSIITIMKNVTSFKAPLVPLYSTVTNVHPMTTNAEQYIDHLILQLKVFKKNNPNVERIVIFIDDLDRLTADEMVSSLEAVRVFMDIPKELVPDDLGVVFILSCDEDKIEKALLDKNNGKEIGVKEARRYLDRIFQFRLDIPPFPKRDMRSYALKKLKEVMPELEEELNSKKVSMDDVVDRLIHVGVQSPRNALQLVNGYVQSMWIAKLREWDGTGSERPGGLYEGTITGKPIILAIITALKIDFPYFYEDLLEEPNLLGDFGRIFIYKNEDGYSTSKSKAILNKYVQKDGTLSEDYEDLRQYISSIQGIKLPKTLQPFLLLSQDSVSRRIGDNNKVYDSLVSGDISGLLDGFNISSIKQKINNEQIRTLEDIAEDIFTDTTSRVENAAYVLGKELSRFERASESITRFIVLKLAEFSSLRNRLSIETIKEISKVCSNQERKDIAKVLIDDFIDYEDEIKFKNPQGETYSSKEIIQVLDSAMDIILDTYSTSGLNDDYKYKLIKWLKERKVKVGGFDDYISYPMFNNWYKKYEKVLIEPLGYHYIDEGLKFLLNEPNAEFIEFFNSEYKDVLGLLWSNGQESKGLVYDLINKSLTIRNEKIVMSSIEEIKSKFESLDETKKNNILIAYLNMLDKELVEPVLSKESLNNVLNSFIEIVPYIDEFNEECTELISNANIKLASKDGYGRFSRELLELTIKKNSSVAESTLEGWVSQKVITLQDECIIWLGNNIASISENLQKGIFVGLELLKQANSNIDATVKEKVNVLMNAITDDDYNIVSVRNFFDSVANSLNSYYNQYNYILNVFPIISKKLIVCSSNIAVDLVYKLFYNGFTSYYDEKTKMCLCREMIGKWSILPKESAQALNIYNTTVNYLSPKNYSESDIVIFESLYTLVESCFDDTDKMYKLNELFANLWKSNTTECNKLLQKYNLKLSPNYIAELAKLVNEENEFKDLENIWSYISKDMESSTFLSVIDFLLKETKESVEDRKLNCWVNINKKFNSELIKYFFDKNLNEEQRKRVIRQIILFAEELKYNELKEFIIKGIAKFSDDELKEIFESEKLIEKLTSDENKEDFNDSIFIAAKDADRLLSRNLIYKWISEKEGHDFILRNKEIIQSDENEENKMLIKEHFPNDKLLEKIL